MPKHDDLINLATIIGILKAAIWTGRIEDENPVSVLLIAEQESAKSQCLLYFQGTPTLRYFTDLTSKPLSHLKSDIEARRIRHLVLLDIVQIMQHQRSVSSRTLSRLASLMEEGQAAVADAGGIEEWRGMPKIGLLAATTPQYYLDHRTHWHRSGFLTRFLPIWFSYQPPTVSRIHQAIRQGFRLPAPKPEPLPEADQSIKVQIPNTQSTLIERLAIEHAKNDGCIYGFRYHRQMRALAKALSAINGRRTVTQSEVKTLTQWQPYFNGTKPITI